MCVCVCVCVCVCACINYSTCASTELVIVIIHVYLECMYCSNQVYMWSCHALILCDSVVYIVNLQFLKIFGRLCFCFFNVFLAKSTLLLYTW